MVSERYYIDVNRPPDEDARAIAELIVQLGRSTHDYVEGLSPAQWNVLRFMSRANQFSRTVSAFAEFHGTTRGTASQTVKSLVSQGYLSRTKSKRDGRSVIFDLTEKGRAVLSRDPCSALVTAAAELPATTRTQLTNGLERLLGRLAQTTNVRPFGACGDCAHVASPAAPKGNTRRLECELRSEALDEAALTQTCINFRPGKKQAR